MLIGLPCGSVCWAQTHAQVTTALQQFTNNLLKANSFNLLSNEKLNLMTATLCCASILSFDSSVCGGVMRICMSELRK